MNEDDEYRPHRPIDDFSLDELRAWLRNHLNMLTAHIELFSEEENSIIKWAIFDIRDSVDVISRLEPETDDIDALKMYARTLTYEQEEMSNRLKTAAQYFESLSPIYGIPSEESAYGPHRTLELSYTTIESLGSAMEAGAFTRDDIPEYDRYVMLTSKLDEALNGEGSSDVEQLVEDIEDSAHTIREQILDAIMESEGSDKQLLN